MAGNSTAKHSTASNTAQPAAQLSTAHRCVRGRTGACAHSRKPPRAARGRVAGRTPVESPAARGARARAGTGIQANVDGSTNANPHAAAAVAVAAAVIAAAAAAAVGRGTICTKLSGTRW